MDHAVCSWHSNRSVEKSRGTPKNQGQGFVITIAAFEELKYRGGITQRKCWSRSHTVLTGLQELCLSIQAWGHPYLILILCIGWFSLIFYKVELFGKEKEKAIMRGIYHIERNRRKAWGMIAFTTGSCRILHIGNSSTKLPSLWCSRWGQQRLWGRLSNLVGIKQPWRWSFTIVLTIFLRLTLDQVHANFCWAEEVQARGKRETRRSSPFPLLQTLHERDLFQKDRKRDSIRKWEQGGRK